MTAPSRSRRETPSNPVDAQCVRVVGDAVAALIARGGIGRVELSVDLHDPDGASHGITWEITARASSGAFAWRVYVGPSSVDVECVEDDPGAAEPREVLDSLVLFAEHLLAAKVVDPSCGASLRGADVIIGAGVTDDTVFWDASGGPFYLERKGDEGATGPAPLRAPRPSPYRCVACAAVVNADHRGLTIAHADAAAARLPAAVMCPIFGRVPWHFGPPPPEDVAAVMLNPDHPEASDVEAVFLAVRPGLMQAVIAATVDAGGVSWWVVNPTGERTRFALPPDAASWYFRPLDARSSEARPWGARR